ncbi:MAG: TRAM domain-containing protein [Candidatus Woesearchaeota archaeon]
MYKNNFGGQNRPNRFAPVKQGEELDVTIETVGEKGDGIAKKDGFVLFIPNVKAGDKVKIKVNKVLKKVGFAEVIGKSTSNTSESNVLNQDTKTEEKEEEISEEDMQNDSEEFGEETDDLEDEPKEKEDLEETDEEIKNDDYQKDDLDDNIDDSLDSDEEEKQK